MVGRRGEEEKRERRGEGNGKKTERALDEINFFADKQLICRIHISS